MSLLAGFTSGFLLGFGIATGAIECAWFSLVFILLAWGLARCEK